MYKSIRMAIALFVSWWCCSNATAELQISSVTSVDATTRQVTVSWVSPGDDGNVGTAATYDMRVLVDTPIINDTTFYTGWVVPNMPKPLIAGTPQSVTFTVDVPPGIHTFYFAMKTADEVPNWSVISNVLAETFSVMGPPENAGWLK